MNPARERQITSIFHSAIAREPHERAPYLDGACGDDEALRREVEELIKSHQSAGSFIESPAFEHGADLLESDVPRTRAGQSIGPYKIISLIGAGGMGEVYRANDARLGREVALKLLLDSTTAGTESVRRFQQEARAASALNHPNILAIYDIGEHDGSPYIVSELLAGETLREKLTGVPLPTRKALDYALQAARGLAAAHEKGIVHRDLKPENLFVTKDGRVKILDFGIAKLVEKTTGALHTEAPTLLVKTDPGMVIGTAGYMSPEQVRGIAVDHRSDIFSFGAIFYEMLSGRRAFRGESMVETLNAILKEEPPELATTNSQVAPEIARVVRRCLEKQPEERFQSASDLAFAIESLSGMQVSGSTNAVAAVTTSATKGVRRTLRDRLGWIVAAVFLVAMLALVAFYFRRAEPRAEVVRFTLPAPDKLSYRGELALSPDGRKLAFVVDGPSGRSLWLRALDSIEARELPGTAEAMLPFWSPDSRFIGFFASSKLKRIDPVSGALQVLADVTVDPRGGAWGPDNTILFTPAYTTPLSKVSANGGPVEVATQLDQSREQTSHRWPSFLPDGRHFLYFVRGRKDTQGIYVGSLDSKDTKLLLNTNVLAAYAPASANAPGYLLFMRDKILMAQPFDPKRLQLTGDATVVAEAVMNFPEEGGPTGYAAFSASTNGHLTYLAGSPYLTELRWFDRSGKSLNAVGSPSQYSELCQSPDGKSVVVGHNDAQLFQDIWIFDLERGTRTRFTFDPAAEGSPVWSGDGSRIFFSSNRDGGTFNLYQKVASGAGSDELLLRTETNTFADDWISGKAGEILLYEKDSSATKFDLWILPLTGDRTPYPYLQTPFNETHAQFSPDGRFVAYASDESGRPEVYVQSFPASRGKWQISTGGGDQPQWRRDGKELFYLAGEKTVMAVSVAAGDAFQPGSPLALFATHIPTTGLSDDRNNFVVSRDGQRFLVNNRLEEGKTQPITLVLNWAAALKQ